MAHEEMAPPSKRKRGRHKLKNSKPAAIVDDSEGTHLAQTANSAKISDQGKRKKPDLPKLTAATLVFATTTCEKYKAVGNLFKLTSERGEIVCCTSCGGIFDERQENIIDKKIEVITKPLSMNSI